MTDDTRQPATALSGVLWDMDGVLVDTGAFHYAAWVETLGRAGLAYSPEMFRATFGMDNRGVLTTLLGREPDAEFLRRISDEKEASFRDAIRGKAQPLPGVHTWLGRLGAAGVPQAVASSAPPANIELLIDSLELRGYFAAIVSAWGMPGKPDPAVFLEAARRIGAPAAGCVVVEDAVAGVEAARRAGMRCIAVTNTNSRRELSGADVVVDSLDDLPADAFIRMKDDINLPPNCIQFLQLLNTHQVEYLVIGGHAVRFHGYQRPILDLDVFIATHSQNAQKLVRVLQDFGPGVAPRAVDFLQMEGRVIRVGQPPFTVERFAPDDRFIQLGVPPTQLEMITSISAVTFEECYPERVAGVIDNVPVQIIGLQQLKANKQASIRPKDADDLAHLS